MPSTKTPASPAKKKRMSYLLPPSLVKLVQLDAVEMGTNPSAVVAERLRKSFATTPVPAQDRQGAAR